MKKILISIPVARGIKYLLDTPLYALLKEKYKIVLLLGIDATDNFKNRYGGKKVCIYGKNESGAAPIPSLFAKFLLQYNLFHSDLRLSELHIGKVNLFTKKYFYPGRYNLFKSMYAIEKLMVGWPLLKSIIQRQCHDLRIDGIVSEERPDLIISTSPAKSYIEYCLQNAAQQQKIPLVFYPASWDDLTRAGEILFEPQKMLTWGPEMSRHAVEFRGTAQNVVAETGLIRMETNETLEIDRTVLLDYFEVPPDHKLILFATSKSDLCLSFPRIVEELAQDVASGALGKAVLIIRPNNLSDYNQREYIEKYRDNKFVRISLPDPEGNEAWQERLQVQWQQILGGVDVIITVCSMMILEAFYYGTPVVCPNYNYGMLNPHGFDYTFYYQREVFRKIKDLGAAPLADSRQALLEMINAYLAEPTLHQERRDQVMSLWDVRPTPPDTRSRMALREIEKMLH